MGFATINFIMLLGFYSLLEPHWIQESHNVYVDSDIPVQFDSFNIVFISDIHYGPFFGESRLIKLVERVNSLNPDAILLGGDYVFISPKYIESFFKQIRNLEAKHKVYAVLGNHDHWESEQLSRKYLSTTSFVDIDNKSAWISIDSAKIKIGGVGDLWYGKQYIDSTIKDVSENDFVVLVSHNPDYAERLETNKIDLMLSGHTHGGQVSFFGQWSPILPSKYGQKYRSGFVQTKKTNVIISNGVGTIAPPVRFMVRPQINIITLKSAKY